MIACLFLVFALAGPPAQPAGPATQVKIHQVLTGRAGYVELRNVGGRVLDVGGWSLRSCAGRAAPAELAILPAGGEIAPGGRLLVAGVAFDGPGETVVPSIPGDGVMLLDGRGVRADAVGWAPDSPCRENVAAAACGGSAESRDPISTDTDDNRADFGCVTPLGGDSSRPE